MEHEVQLKLQAYLDGELSEAEAREIGNLLAKDREAVALQNELRNTRQALAGFETGTELRAELGPVVRADVQKTVLFTPPGLVLAELRAHHRELQIELRIVRVIQLVVRLHARRKQCGQDDGPDLQSARCRARHDDFLLKKTLVRARVTSSGQPASRSARQRF